MEHQDIKQIYSQRVGKKLQTGRNRAHSAKRGKSARPGKNVLPFRGQVLMIPTSISTCHQNLAVNIILRGKGRSLWSNKREKQWPNGNSAHFFFLLQDFSEPLLLRKCTVNLWEGRWSAFSKSFSAKRPWWSSVHGLGNNGLDREVIFLGEMYFLGKCVMPARTLRIIALCYLELQQPSGQTSTKQLCFFTAKVWPFLSVIGFLISTVRPSITLVLQVWSRNRKYGDC